jgi:peptidoglycan/xylan/chitin deacetylase (PgdA/CDA1 family)
MCSTSGIARFLAHMALCAAIVSGGVLFVDSTRSATNAVTREHYHPDLAGAPRSNNTQSKQKPNAITPTSNLLISNKREEAEWGLGGAFKKGAVMTGASSHRLILFTFDDGPDRRTTPLLLDRLDAVGIKAVFFLVARRIASQTPLERQHANIAREIVRRGHIVGNHTHDHLQLPLLDNDDAIFQIVETERIFRKVFGGRPWLIRPPGGARSPRIDKILWKRGYTTMLWNIGAGDFQLNTAEQVYKTWRKVFNRRQNDEGERGGIIMLHDTHPWSVDAFQLIVSDLMDRNCRLLKKGEELFDIVDDPSFFFRVRSKKPEEAQSAPLALDPQLLASRQQRLRRETAQRCRLNTFQ